MDRLVFSCGFLLPYPTATSPRVSSELEQARPQTSGEEELQLQLALAMSREVAEQVSACLVTLVLLGGGVWLPERMTHTALSLRHLFDEFGLVATVYSHLLDQAELYLGKVFMEVSVQRNI